MLFTSTPRIDKCSALRWYWSRSVDGVLNTNENSLMLKLNSFEGILYEPGLGGGARCRFEFCTKSPRFFFYSCLGSVFRPLNNATYFMILIWKEYNIIESFIQHECLLAPAQLLHVKVIFPPSPFYALSRLQLNSPTGQLYRASLIFGPRRIKY